MTPDQIITIATGILQGGGILVFIYYYIGGLKKKILALNATIDLQSKTLEVMERRIEETRGVGEIYKDLLNEIPEDLKKYKDFIRESKDAMIEELKKKIEDKDHTHRKEIEKGLARIHEQEKSIAQLLKARNNLIAANDTIREGMESIANYYESQDIRNSHAELRSIEIYIQHKGQLNISASSVAEMKLIADASHQHSSDRDVIDVSHVEEADA